SGLGRPPLSGVEIRYSSISTAAPNGYVCKNRIVWGADQYTEIRIRHTKGAPDRWLEEIAPVLKQYDEGSAQPVTLAIEAAREKRIQDDLDGFLAKRFGARMVEPIKAIHLVEEE